MSRGFYVAWGGDGDGVQHEVFVDNVDQLERLLDDIELAAIQAQCVYQVDLWLAQMKAQDPILLQFLIGHPQRSSLLWHEDGTTMIAAVKLVQPISEGIACKRYSVTKIMDPELTMITPSAVRDALVLYLLTHSQPDFLLWTEAEQD